MAGFVSNAATGVDMRNLWPGMGFTAIASTLSATATDYAVLLNTGLRAVYLGTGFTYAGDAPTGGTYTVIELRSGDGLTLLGTLTTGAGGALLSSIGNVADWRDNPALLGGASSMSGLGGADRLIGGSGSTTFHGGGGLDSIDGGAGTDTLVVNYTAVGSSIGMSGGTSGSITTANGLNGVTYAGIERFQIYGTTGADTLRGDALDDVLDGATGADSMVGGAGDDVYVVDNAVDIVFEDPGAGTDTVYFRLGGQTLANHIEVARLTGAASSVTGNTLDNALVGNDSGLAASLNGGAGNDTFWSGPQADTMDGGSGHDVFYTGGGADRVIGGIGDDQVVVYDLGVVLLEAAGEGTETYWVGVAGAFLMDAHTEIARLFDAGSGLIGNAQNNDLVANVTASSLSGQGGDDVLWGQGGADTLTGGAGNDIFRTGGGADSCSGGADNDSYVILDTGAVVTELAGQGYDIVYMGAAGAFFIGENIEEARLFGAGNALTGGANGELLVGNNAGVASSIEGRGGADLIYGSTAGDSLSGGAGDDTLYGLSGADQFRFTEAGWGFDQIADFSRAEGDRLFMIGSGITDFAQLQIISGGNTQITANGDVIYLFGVAGVTAADFIFA